MNADTDTAPNPSRARAAFLHACRLDVEAAKPGNVSVQSAGHGMTAAQFIDSGEAAADALFARGTPVGERILAAVTRTQACAGCNTNLGIVLLVAPLAAALEGLCWPPGAAAWRDASRDTLARLDLDDARAAYRAIALANPGGLGDAPAQSVHAPPTVDLRSAMTLAAGRDSIARQYANGFEDIFATGLAAVRDIRGGEAGYPPAVVTLHVFLTFLGRWPDSHIVRKQGVTLAQSVTLEARAHHARLRRTLARPSAGVALSPLDEWDAELKARGINPGTSADLTVATLFVAGCVEPASVGLEP